MTAFIIYRDKFTNGLIHFFHDQFPEESFIFFTTRGKWNIEKNDQISLYEVSDYGEITNNVEYLERIKLATKIIISGVFLSRKDILTFLVNGLIRHGLLNKTYFHFWGGDFYCYRKNLGVLDIKARLRKMIMFYVFRKARGLVFLLDSEYEKYQEITHITNRHFVGQVSSSRSFDFTKYRNKSEEKENITNILVGNSATDTNQHLEVFEELSKYKPNSIKIYCPLSYGSEDYRDVVIQRGRELFGDAFVPVTEYVAFEEYVKLLAKMDIGIFNNDRQQGMGNIGILMKLGKKVYMRTGTSMWNDYKNQGLGVFPIDEIGRVSFQEFSCFSKEQAEKNESVLDSQDNRKLARTQWSIILDDSVSERKHHKRIRRKVP